MTVPQCLSRRILLSPLSSTPPPHHNYITTTTKSAVPISNWSQFHQFQTLPLLFFTSSPKPISIIPPFLVCSSGSRPVSQAGVSTTSVHVGYHEGKETTDASNLKEKVEGLGIHCDSCTPGRYTLLTCPKCKGGQSMERGLSFHMSKYGDFAMWRCFHVDCGWAGQIIAYFTERKISNDILLRNAVMQLSGDQNTMAFTYRRNGVIASCKYRSLDRRFWQEKTIEKILYGLDDIKEANEIIIVEGEIDKLSMEEAGFINCVSVPDGAPQKVSAELPPLEKDSRFRYLWNCKEYLDKVSRIILATDGDMPGDVLAEEIARRLGRERCWRVCWPKKDEFSYCKDANEVLMNLGTDALRDVVNNAVLYPNHNLLQVK